MAYAQWMVATISPIRFNLSIKNALLAWGKFYKNPNKDDELTPAQIDAITIADGSTGTVASCGRSDAASGTEGSIDIYDGNVQVGTFYWNCPWGSKSNSWTWTPIAPTTKYVVQVSGFNLDSGALGNGTITVVKI